MTKSVYFILVLLTLGFLFIPAITAQTTEFTYQGSLRDGGQTPNANYDFEFRLYDAREGGTQIGSVLTRTAVPVSEGIFAVTLDFPGGFPGADRYLEIAVRAAGGGGFTVLNPRQKFQSTPYAIQSLNAASAINAQQLNGVASNQFVLTTDSRLTNARTPTAGSANYVQNTTSVQAASNFNISGTGSAGILNSSVQFNINGQHVLSAGGPGNLFAGIGSGQMNTLGTGNAFFGSSAGSRNTSGIDNAFVGSSAGFGNTTGKNNSFFGGFAGEANTTGSDNSFFGQRSGGANSTGINNAFFGSFSGLFNSTGSDNSFFGTAAGYSNNASRNSFFGSMAGHQNTTGANNSFIGAMTGQVNTLGSNNSFVGSNAGRGNTTGANNTYVGAASGVENATGLNNSFFGVNAGSANKVDRNSFFGSGAGAANNFGMENSFFGQAAGRANTTGERNTFFGYEAGKSSFTGSFNTIVGAGADVVGENLTNATAIGANALVSTSNTVVLGRPLDTVRVPGSLNVTGSISGTFTVPATSITGVLATANGGTGLSSAGPLGNFLRSNGSIWMSSPLIAADIPANSTHYIQNGTALQTPGNFNISGSGTVGGLFSANIVNATTQYNIAGSRVLSNAGSGNLFAGVSAGAVNTGSSNAFFGSSAGAQNTTAGGNSFFGTNSGLVNSNGFNNSFFGVTAGQSNTSGSRNTFFGANAGQVNTAGANNTLIGAGADTSGGSLSYATAIGADSVVGTSNTVVLGRAADTVRIPGNLNVSGTITGSFTVPASNITGVLGVANGGTGLSASGASGNFLRSNGTGFTSSAFSPTDIPANSTHYIQNGTALQTPGNFNISGNGTLGGTLSANVVNSATNFNIAGNRVFSINGTGNVFAGAGTATTGSSNSFFGNGAGAANVSGSSNTIIGADANVASGALTNATAIGARALAAQNDSIVLGGINLVNGATADTRVGIGTNTPKERLEVSKGNILVGSPGQGIILKSPNGTTCRLLAISDIGAMTLTAVTCP